MADVKLCMIALLICVLYTEKVAGGGKKCFVCDAKSNDNDPDKVKCFLGYSKDLIKDVTSLQSQCNDGVCSKLLYKKNNLDYVKRYCGPKGKTNGKEQMTYDGDANAMRYDCVDEEICNSAPMVNSTIWILTSIVCSIIFLLK